MAGSCAVCVGPGGWPDLPGNCHFRGDTRRSRRGLSCGERKISGFIPLVTGNCQYEAATEKSTMVALSGDADG
jgi:hypothetical protein